MGKEYDMRSLLTSVILLSVLAIFLTLSGCTKNSYEAQEHDTMDLDSKKQSAVEKDTQSSGTKLQTSCPVMGGNIEKTIFADHKGKRVYFCCKMCIAKFEEEPEKYMEKM